jgi:anti-anti-sigma factor
MLTVLDEGAVPVARLEGEIDAANVDDVGDGLRALMTNRSYALVVDLSPTTYIDSAGLNLLFGLAEDLRGRQQELHLVVAGQSPIARMVSLTGLDVAVPTHPTVTAAVARATESGG